MTGRAVLRGAGAGLWLAMAAMPALAQADRPAFAPVATQAPAGTYRLDLAHGRLLFRVSHLGFSNYTAFFRDFDATLAFDPADPEAMTVEATVDPASVETLYPDPAFDFNAVIAGPEFLDAAQFPEMTFRSTRVRMTGPDRAAVTGDLTLHGVTRPITLRVTFNGGYPPQDFDPGGARIGFSATGTLFRSDFGIGYGIPAPGSTLGVSDAVEIVIEAEFINPDASGGQPGP
ncbi:YceI family protein [Frigidibacter oleivorans]|uniref:YceI family protein n=1 Tax=Frigidibacter oleivorans TaxID=2487129 RepID=UPI000F8C685B|nr:YceI family protein [Frigidibacter oleivorans]